MDLKKEQSKYRVFVDSSFDYEKESGKTAEKWRYYEIRGKYGYIYPWDEKDLCVCFTSNKIARKVEKNKNWPLIQSGDDETVYRFNSSELYDVAQAIVAKRRRIVSPETAGRLSQWQFKRSG